MKILGLVLQKYEVEMLDKTLWVNKSTWVKNYVFSKNGISMLCWVSFQYIFLQFWNAVENIKIRTH